MVGTLATAALLAWLLAGRREEFTSALSSAALWVIALTTLLQAIALVSRSEAWHITIEAAGGTVPRRVLYRASSVQVLGGTLNSHLGVAARIAALRRSSPDACPQVPTLVAAEFPILAVEAMLAAGASFTLVAPLGLPWWLPIAILFGFGLASAGLRRLALGKGRELWRGLAVLRSLSGGTRVVGFVLVAVFAQILRNWLLLHAVGVDASIFDAVAVLIAVVTLGQLPVGPERRRGVRGPDPRQRRRRRCRCCGTAPDGHGHPRRPVLCRLGRCRPSVGGGAPTPTCAPGSRGHSPRGLRPPLGRVHILAGVT